MRYQQVRGASPLATGLSQQAAEPVVSALRASIPSAALLELAGRCERAAGSDRELDELIAAAADGAVREVQSDGRTAYHSSDGSRWVSVRVPEPGYTASLDAAMTLVPEGRRRVEFGSYEGGRAWAYVHTPADVVGETDDTATEALAVCAAALRAHAASAGEAGTATTVQQGVVHEHATAGSRDAPKDPS